MYNQNDMQEARRSLNRWRGLLASVLALLLAAYVRGIVMGRQGLMLAVLMAGFVCTLVICDLKLMPAQRYARFLREMEKGLRRNLDCILESLEMEEQIQDGIRVRALYVRMDTDGDSRVLYVNASKVELLPSMGTRVRLTGYGRHVVSCEVL